MRKKSVASHDPVSTYTRYLFAGHAEQSSPTHGNDTTNNGTTTKEETEMIINVEIPSTIEVDMNFYVIGADTSLCCMRNDHVHAIPHPIRNVGSGSWSLARIVQVAAGHEAQQLSEYR